MRVAIDAMGGDHAPRENVGGAIAASRADAALQVVLVGDETALQAELAKHESAPALTIVHASQVIGMGDKPVEALKTKPDASIVRAIALAAAGEVDAVVAPGSTGATVAASMMLLKRLPGVRRPGIAVPLPAANKHGCAFLIDAGANPECRAHHLFQYGVMASNYYKAVFSEDQPRVGLVSIGEEETKGTTLTKETAALLRDGPVHFIGNTESLFRGDCEVAVADGFVGNVILKSAEGLAELLLGEAARELRAKHPEALGKLMKRFDWAEFGGAPLLGVDGVVTISHGRSDARALANAIRMAARAAELHVNEAIVAGLQARGAAS